MSVGENSHREPMHHSFAPIIWRHFAAIFNKSIKVHSGRGGRGTEGGDKGERALGKVSGEGVFPRQTFASALAWRGARWAINSIVDASGHSPHWLGREGTSPGEAVSIPIPQL